MPATKVKEFLRKNNVNFETVVHTNVFTAQGTAAVTHTPGKNFAKTVIVNIDGKFAMTVLPAMDLLSIRQLQHALGAANVRLADEAEFAALFPDCDVGAMPPFGNLYDLPVYVDQTIAQDEWIAFNAGTHREAIRMKYADFTALVQPKIINLTRTRVAKAA